MKTRPIPGLNVPAVRRTLYHHLGIKETPSGIRTNPLTPKAPPSPVNPCVQTLPEGALHIKEPQPKPEITPRAPLAVQDSSDWKGKYTVLERELAALKGKYVDLEKAHSTLIVEHKQADEGFLRYKDRAHTAEREKVQLESSLREAHGVIKNLEQCTVPKELLDLNVPRNLWAYSEWLTRAFWGGYEHLKTERAQQNRRAIEGRKRKQVVPEGGPSKAVAGKKLRSEPQRAEPSTAAKQQAQHPAPWVAPQPEKPAKK